MDSTLIHPKKPSASKLPIKRKISDPSPDPVDPRAPPFKFHRIWTEPDEIRFLEGLLDCASQRLSFPRDLRIFYDRFSNTMPQPYTKSQLSEKLRRLRKKFRVVSARLDKGLDRSQLSVHDRALYELSERLWHPDYAATSPFNGNRNVGLVNQSGEGGVGLERSGLVGIKVDFSPSLAVVVSGSDQENEGDDDDDVNLELDFLENENVGGDGGGFDRKGDFCNEESKNEEVKLSEVNVEFEGEEGGVEDDGNDTFGIEKSSDFRSENKVAVVAAKVVMSVFDECCKDVKGRLMGGQGGESVSAESFKVRWQQQRIAELDVLGSRLRLALEHSLSKN